MLQQVSYSAKELDAMFDPINSPDMQLPQAPLRMIDRVTRISAEGGRWRRGEIITEYDISPDSWFFDCHFPGDPVMPGCLGLDGLWQSLGFFLAWSGFTGRGRALGVGEVKFLGEVTPEAGKVTYHVDVRRILSRDVVIGMACGTLAADGKVLYQVEGLKTALVPAAL